MLRQLLLVVGLTLPLGAQDLSQLHLSGQPEKSEAEFVGASVRDANGRTCAAIKVISDLDGFKYTSYNGVVKVDDLPGQDLVYLSPDEQVLEIFLTNYKPLKLLLADQGIRLQERQVWTITIAGDKPKASDLSIGILVTPPGAEVFIDGISRGRGEEHVVAPGSHQLRLVKQGFQTLEETIQVAEKSTIFRFTMQEVKDVVLLIESEPAGAAVYIDGVKLGETPLSSFYAPGRRKLQLTLDWYIPHEQEIDVAPPQVRLNIRLRENFARLTVNSAPESGLDIYLNDLPQQNRTPFTFERLAPGTYRVKARSAHYETNEESLVLAAGDRKNALLRSNASYALLTVRTMPGTTVYLNGKKQEQLENIRLEPSVVLLRAERPKAAALEQRVTLRKGDAQTIELMPVVAVGTIQVAVTPFEARVELRGDAGELYTSAGAKIFENVPVGTYTLKVSQSDYTEKQETLVLKAGEKITRSVTLARPAKPITQAPVQGTAGVESGTVTDIDGNVYHTVKIGNQWWMAENLKVKKYRNGDAIQNVTDAGTWSGLTTGAHCNYDNSEANAVTYGRLYNWYAVNDSRNIAPEGWHVPSDAEWKQLEMHLGMSQSEADAPGWRGTNEGGKLKEKGTAHWNSPNTGASDDYGFTALPGGYRLDDGNFYVLGNVAHFWSSTENSTSSAWFRYLYYDSASISRYSLNKQVGFSVRCVRD